ncbi:unnamed protein product, partial [Mesorhabditis spiculigera]
MAAWYVLIPVVTAFYAILTCGKKKSTQKAQSTSDAAAAAPAVPALDRFAITDLKKVDINEPDAENEAKVKFDNEVWKPKVTIKSMTITEANYKDALKRFNGGPVRHEDPPKQLPKQKPKKDLKVKLMEKCTVYIVYKEDACRAGEKDIADTVDEELPADKNSSDEKKPSSSEEKSGEVKK